MDEEKIKRVKEMTQEDLEKREREIEFNTLNKLHEVKIETVDFDEEKATKNLEELKAIGYNFEYEQEEEDGNN